MMHLKEGYIKSNEFSKALDRITFSSKINCPSGDMKDFTLNVDDFSINMGSESLSGSLQLACQNRSDFFPNSARRSFAVSGFSGPS